jgi:hypothetical protein
MNIKIGLIACFFAAIMMSCEKGKEERSETTLGAPAPASLESEANLKSESSEALRLSEEGLLSKSYSAGDTVMITTSAADATASVSSPPKKEALSGQVAPVKKLIKNGNLRMEVDDYAKSRKKINTLLPKYNAYIGGENENNDGHKIQGTVTIRVPFGKFDGLMDAVSEEGDYIASKTVTVDDVTAEYVDLSARLKTKLEVEDRYRDILKKAQKIPDILSVENELRVIREEIEAAQGRMKYINDQAQYSTLSLEMYEILPYSTPPQAGFFSNIAEAFVNGWRGLLGFLVGLTSIWPFLLILSVAIFFLRKFWKRKVFSVNEQLNH